MTRRLVPLTLACTLLLGAPLVAEAQKSKKAPSAARIVELRYEGGAVPFVVCLDCPTVVSARNERYVTVEVVDDVSPVGYVDIAWHSGGHGFFPVCGQTSEPMKIPAGTVLTIYPWVAPSPDCPQGLSTSGVVRLTFSQRP